MTIISIISLFGFKKTLVEQESFDLTAFGLQNYNIFRSNPSDIYMINNNGSIYVLKLCDYNQETFMSPPMCSSCQKMRYTFFPGINCRSCNDLLYPIEFKRQQILCFDQYDGSKNKNATGFIVSITLALQLLLGLIACGICYKYRNHQEYPFCICKCQCILRRRRPDPPGIIQQDWHSTL